MSKKILQINTVVNTGSTGHIAEDLGVRIIKENWESYIAYGRKSPKSISELIKVSNIFDFAWHLVLSRLFDIQGLSSFFSTLFFIKKINIKKPDLIHLHNIHGYYLNYPIFFKWIKKENIPLIWTLHDSWSYTGHCAYYTFAQCSKWKYLCNHCPNKFAYPKSLFFSNCKLNYFMKKKYFTLPTNLTIVTPSNWLSNEVKESFLSKYHIKVINNGINLEIFKPYKIYSEKKIILGVANVWDDRKGLKDFIQFLSLLNDEEEIILIGLNTKQISTVPKQIVCIERTENQEELAMYYSKASVFLNLTYEDNFPTTNLEALACGTPVITYNTGGSPESIDEQTGYIVEQGDIETIRKYINIIEQNGKEFYKNNCVNRAKQLYDKNKCYEKYIELYNSLLYKKLEK